MYYMGTWTLTGTVVGPLRFQGRFGLSRLGLSRLYCSRVLRVE